MFAGIILAGAFLLSVAVVYVANWLALISWRRNRTQHWSEQARVVYPVLAAAGSNQLSVPAIVTILTELLWPDSSPLWLFAGLASVLGVVWGTMPAYREVFPRIVTCELLKQRVMGLLIRLAIWLGYLAAAIAMPDTFNWLALVITAAMILFYIFCLRGGMIWLMRQLGYIGPAPARLQAIVDQTSGKMGVACKSVWLMRSPVAQAYAFPHTGQIMLSERLMAIASDDEVAAICAHELAHLTESWSARYARLISAATFLPWIFFNPVMHLLGPLGFFVLLFTSVFAPRLFRKLSVKLEKRADQMAQANEGDAGTYARALQRLYEDNLIPAVMARKQSTHPDLYDRLIAAGVTPDFPKPEPASSLARYGSVLAGLAGGLFAILAMKLAHMFTAD